MGRGLQVGILAWLLPARQKEKLRSWTVVDPRTEQEVLRKILQKLQEIAELRIFHSPWPQMRNECPYEKVEGGQFLLTARY